MFWNFSGCGASETDADSAYPPAVSPAAPEAGELRLLYDREPASFDYLASDEEDVLRLDPEKGDRMLKAMLDSCLVHEVSYGRYKA